MIKLSKNNAKLLKLFYTHPNESFYIQQLGRILKKKPGVFQRALYALEKEGALKSEYKANARFFRANTQYSIYKELKSILSKTAGLSVILAIFFFGPSFLKAASCQAEEQSGLILNSLGEAISIAYKNNKDIQIQEKEADISRANILGARSEFLPDVNVVGGYTHNGAVFPSTATSTEPKKDFGVFGGYKNDNQLGVSVGQIVYNGGANIANYRQSKIAFSEQEETLRATKLNVELQGKQLYYGLLLAYETERIAQDLLDQAQAHYLKVEQMFQQGTASKFDMLQSKVQVSLLVPELVNAENSIGIIMAELNKLLGLKVQQRLLIKDNLTFAPFEIKEDEFLKSAYLNKPEMILKSLGIDMDKWGIKFAKAGWLPQVNASADYNFRSNNTANMFNNRHSNWNIGVSLSIPIFDGFATKAKVEAARAKYSQSLISKENVADQIAVSIRQDCLDLKQAAAIIKSQQDNLEDAKEALKIADVRFENGIGINLDVLDAQVALAQVKVNLAQGIYDYLVAQADLDRNMGKEYLLEAKNEKKN